MISNLNAGELSPILDARSDIQKYGSGCRTLENFIPMVEGGVKRTPGAYFVMEVKNSAHPTRIKGFSFSTSQAYQIEMGNLYFRFYKDQGQIVIDTSMDNFDPSKAFFIGEYTKLGSYRDLD